MLTKIKLAVCLAFSTFVVLIPLLNNEAARLVRSSVGVPTSNEAESTAHQTTPQKRAIAKGKGTTAKSVDFTRDVQPIFQASCYACHGAQAAQADLRLDSKAAIMQGGVSGRAIIPGNNRDSLLVQRIVGHKGMGLMPPAGPPLAPEKIAIVRSWIDQGAVWPDETTIAASQSQTPAGTTKTLAGKEVDFVRDVQPILRASCYQCHSGEQPKAQLRLDAKALALRGGISGPVIIPGKGKESRLIHRVLGHGGERRMPLGGKPLTANQIAVLRTWIDGGANWPGETNGTAEAKIAKHWAYEKPVRSEPPTVKNRSWVRNPIDNFVLARLDKEGMNPSPEASKETLIRRLTLDLTGLPPSLKEVDDFLSDSSANAYERVVDRLLASPHYGERWARPWLDLARYADTNGYEKDRRRSAWKYRDWVINAFNQDMPFDRFTIEQIAGDMLPNATTEQRIATGFHRNAMLNEEGGVDPEETRWETLVDRVSTTATVWLGTTLACAQCHNHKFDPLTQKEFYRFLAFFNNAEYELVGPANVSEQKLSEPKLELPTQEQAARRRELEAEIDKLKAIIESPSQELDAGQAAWEREVTRAENDWITLDPIDLSSTGGSTLTKSADKTILVTGENPEKDTYVVTAKTNLRNITGIRLEVLTDPKLPQNGPGRDPYGNFILTGFEVAAALFTTEPTTDSAKNTQQSPSLVFTDAVADDAQRGLEVKNLVKRETKDSEVYQTKESKGWGIDATKENSRINRQAVFVAEKPFGTATETLLKIKLKHEAGYIGQGIGRFRLSVTTAQNPTSVVNVVAPLRFILAIPVVHRTEQQKKDLAAYYRSTTSPQLKATRDSLVEVRKSLDKLGIVSTLVMQERSSHERPSTYLRIRGSYTAQGEQVFAGVPAALHPLSENQPSNRLGLARWLVDENNPLTARVAVNQFWEQFFGRGIVETSEDFGTQGQRPTHPELLDWLATEFVREGWSMKKLHRLVVTSATYRQSAKATPALLERDPYNRLLARGPRFRIEAEMIRDMALAASGQLSRKIGGPSVFPSQPEGVWSIPYNDDQWSMSEGEDRFRRGLYTFIRRTSPYPGLTNFDAPSREFCTVRRVRTNTPLQALTTLNDLAFFDAARSLAKRIMTEAGADERERAVLGFRLCVTRRPKAEELDQIIALYNEQRARFKQNPEAARKVAHGPQTTEKTDGAVATAPAEGDAAETAAWVMTANILLNLDETVTKE